MSVPHHHTSDRRRHRPESRDELLLAGVISAWENVHFGPCCTSHPVEALPMPWPIAQDYVEAIREPSTCFADTELQRGTVVVNAEGLPVSRAGDSSQVFAIRAGNRTWAIKCFTRPLANLPERYAEIMRYLRHVQLPCMVECTFTPQGIRVHGEWYPVVKMPWVNGATLYTFVRDNLDRPAVLQMLAQTWVRVATR